MPSTMELETLVTRMTGDASGLLRALTQSENALQRYADSTARATARVMANNQAQIRSAERSIAVAKQQIMVNEARIRGDTVRYRTANMISRTSTDQRIVASAITSAAAAEARIGVNEARIKAGQARIRMAQAQIARTHAQMAEVEGAVTQVGGILSRLGSIGFVAQAALVGVGVALGGITIAALRASANMELMTVSFRALIGSGEEAMKLLDDLTAYALATPYSIRQITEAAIELTAFGRGVDEILPDLRMLGDIAKGDTVAFSQLVGIYAKVIESGRLYQRDINQLARRGVNVYLELAKMLGFVAENAEKVPNEVNAQLRVMIREGKISSEMVEEIFKRITSPGGKYFGLMSEGLKTLTGAWNKLEEQSYLTLVKIGDMLVSAFNIKPILRELADLGEQFNTFMDNMSPKLKETIKTVLLLTGVVIALAAAVTVAYITFSILLGPIGVILAVVSGLIALTTKWVMTVGGLEDAWFIVKRAATDFWNFVKPILPAIAAGILLAMGPLGIVTVGIILLIAYWAEVKEAVLDFYRFAQPSLRAIWDLVKSIGFGLRTYIIEGIAVVTRIIKDLGVDIAAFWKQLMGRDFTGLKEDFRDFFIFIEYGLKNVGTIAAVMAAWAYLKFITFIEDTKHSFTHGLPAVMEMFFVYWKSLWEKMLSVANAVIVSLVQSVADGVGKLPDIIAGKVKLEDVFSDAFKRVRDEIAKAEPPVLKMPEIKPRDETAAEKVAKTLVAALEEHLQKGFKGFKEEKLFEWKVEDAMDLSSEFLRKIVFPFMFAQGEAKTAGQAAGRDWAQAFGKEVKAVDAVLFDSAEATSRINEYMSTLRDPMMIDKTRQNIEIAPMPHEAGQQKIVDVLERIDMHILDQNNKIEMMNMGLAPAGLF